MGKGFILQADPDTTVYKVFDISSHAYTIGDLVDVSRTAHDVVPSTSTSPTYNVRGVAMQTTTTADTTLLVALATPRQTWTVDVTATASATHNGQRMVLTDERTVNNTGTDSTTVYGVFEQTGIVGTTRVSGRILAATNITA